MPHHGEKEILSFLQALDSELAAPCEVILIGGAALLLAFHLPYVTKDIDALRLPQSLRGALRRLLARGTSQLPLEETGVWNAPGDFEQRLVSLPLPLLHLKVLVPEAHDLALMKIDRGYAADLDAIEALHRAHPLNRQRLLALYQNMAVDRIGRRPNFRLNFLAAYARLFGEAAARRLQTQRAL